jgi:hypothetical protein
LIQKFKPNLRAVFLSSKPFENAERRPSISRVDDLLQWYGLRSDAADCATITVHGLPPALEIRFQSLSTPLEPQNRDSTYVVTCRVVPETADRSALITRRRAVNLVLDRLEDACPKLFQPRHLVTVIQGDAWRRLYGGTDLVASVAFGRVTFSDQIRPHGLIDVGSERDWAKAPMRLDCGKRNGVYFAHVLPPTG